MYDMVEFDTQTNFTDADDIVYIDTPHPILRVHYVEDLTAATSGYQIYNNNNTMQAAKIDKFEVLNVKPVDRIDPGFIYFKPHEKRIYLKNNKNKYRIHYLHYFDNLEYTDETLIPIPNVFLWALYSLVMWYIYPNYGQMGDNEEQNAFNKAKDQLQNLAKTDSLQISGIDWSNIH